MYHRRQRTEALEAKVKETEKLETDNEELQGINDALLQELEKRDQAVQEAVGIICELEAKVEMLEAAALDTRPTTALLDSEISATDQESLGAPQPQKHPIPVTPDPPNYVLSRQVTSPSSPESPPPLPKFPVATPQEPRTPFKTPSFMRDAKQSTNALRSLYSLDDTARNETMSFISLSRPKSLFSQDDDQQNLDPDSYALNSPRLSVLSESSFLSVYGKLKRSPQRSDSPPAHEEEASEDEEGSSPSDKDQQDAKIQKWMETRDQQLSPRKSRKGPATNSILSIGEMLHDIPILPKPNRTQYPPKQDSSFKTPKQNQNGSPILGGLMFGQHPLPPTPKTMDSAILGTHTPGSISAGSLLDGTMLPVEMASSSAPSPPPRTGYSTPARVADHQSPQRHLNLDDPLRQQQNAIYLDPSKSEIDHGLQDFSHSPPLIDTSPRINLQKSRPPLNVRASDIGHRIERAEPSRTVSYPTPIPHQRRRSSQSRPSQLSRVDSAPLSPKEWLNGSSNTTTTPLHDRRPHGLRTLSRDYDISTTVGTEKLPIALPPVDGSQYLGPLPRSSSIRSMMPKLSSTKPGPASSKSTLASRLFRRRSNSQSPQSASQSIQTAPTETTEPMEPLLSRPPLATERKPRPTSFYATSTGLELGLADNAKRPSRIGRPGTAGGSRPGTAGSSRPGTAGSSNLGDVDGAGSFGWDSGFGSLMGRPAYQRTVSVSNAAGEGKWGAMARSKSLRIKEGFIKMGGR